MKQSEIEAYVASKIVQFLIFQIVGRGEIIGTVETAADG